MLFYYVFRFLMGDYNAQFYERFYKNLFSLHYLFGDLRRPFLLSNFFLMRFFNASNYLAEFHVTSLKLGIVGYIVFSF